MKRAKNFTTILLIACAVLMISLQITVAAKEDLFSPPRVGVVGVKEIFDKCPMKNRIEKQLSGEGDERYEELKKLEAQLQADKDALSKRKQNSDDYLDMMKEILLRQSALEAKKEFYQQELTVKEMQGKEQIYRAILKAVETVAEEKGLDMVITRDDNYLNRPQTNPPAQSPSDLILTTKTHKLLYFDSKLDITADVLSAMEDEK